MGSTTNGSNRIEHSGYPMAEWVWIIFLQLVAHTEAFNSHGRLGNVSSILSFKNGTLTFGTATLLELHSATPWLVRLLHQTLVKVSPFTNTTIFSFGNLFSSSQCTSLLLWDENYPSFLMGAIHRIRTCYLHSLQPCPYSTAFWTILHMVRTNSRFEVWIQALTMETYLLSLELPWFGEMPGYYNTHPGGPMYPPTAGMTPGYGYPYHPPMSAPGHSIVIQPGMNGAPPIVTQTQ